MKTKIFIFAMLASVAASAQSHINIEMLSATYTASPAVKFRVSWSSIPAVTGQTHNAKVWVWIDFLKVNADNTTAGNTWTRAEISATPAVSSSPTSMAALDASTNKGFWLNGVTGSYSATVTATLSNIPANTRFNWCAYASDCPPNVMATNGTYTFKGTPPFTLTASGGATQTVTGTTLAASALTVTPTTIRDKTECPGVFCPYQGRDLYIDATHLCQQRTGGAQNWEAYIKDSRDNLIYRIVQFSDQSWWFADDLATTDKRVNICSGVSMYYPTDKPTCPAGWQIPTQNQIKNRWPNGEISDIYGNEFTNVAKFYQTTCNLTTSWPNFGVFLIISECYNGLQWEINNKEWFFWGNEIGNGCSGFSSVRAARVRCLR